jgi:hypothetical protein
VGASEDAVRAYEDANERLEVLKAEWERLGRPILAEGGSTGRVPVVHPLLKAINEAEVIADRLRERVRVKHRGPHPAAVLGIEVSEPRPKPLGLSPAAVLRRRNGR